MPDEITSLALPPWVPTPGENILKFFFVCWEQYWIILGNVAPTTIPSTFARMAQSKNAKRIPQDVEDPGGNTLARQHNVGGTQSGIIWG